MRKKFSVALVALMGLTLFACGKKTDTKPTDTKPTQTDTSEIVVKKYTVTVVNSIQNAGTIAGAGQIEEGKSTTLKATAADGYTFLGFYDGETRLSAEGATECTITVTKDVTITAKWTAKSYNLTVKSFSNVDPDDVVEFDDESLGTVEYTNEHDGVYTTGEVITLTATPKTGYQFNGWYLEDVVEGDHLISMDPEHEFAMVPQNATIKAIFGTKKCTVEVVANMPEAANELIIDDCHTGGEAINNTLTVDYGTEVNIYTNVNNGYSFLGFYEYREDDDYSTSTLLATDYYFNAEDSIKFLAVFEANEYQLSIYNNDATAGDITVVYGDNIWTNTNVSMEYNTSVTLTAAANAGYTFVGWYADGSYSDDDLITTDATYTFKMIYTGENWSDWAQEEYIYAKFVANDVQVNFSVDSVDEFGNPLGTINVESGKYAYNSTIRITATPNEGYKFDGWYIKTWNTETEEYDYELYTDGWDDEFNVETTEEISIAAKFSIASYDVYLGTNIENVELYDAILAANPGIDSTSFEYGTTITVTAPTVTGYTFLGWYYDGDCVYDGETITNIDSITAWSETAECTFTMWAGALDCLIAAYSRNQYNIRYVTDGTVVDEEGHNVNGSRVSYGLNYTLHVPTMTGKNFKCWYFVDDDTLQSIVLTDEQGKSLAPFTYTSNIQVQAEWLTAESIVSFDTDGGDDVDSQTVPYGGKASRPVPDPEKTGYTFVNWFDEDGIEWSFNTTINENTVIYAHWTINQYTITIESQNNDVVVVNSNQVDGTYDYGTELELVATVLDDGYKFAGWYLGETLISDQAIYTYTLPAENVTLVAKYEAKEFDVQIYICWWAVNTSYTWLDISNVKLYLNGELFATGYKTGETTHVNLKYKEEFTLTVELDPDRTYLYVMDWYTNITGGWGSYASNTLTYTNTVPARNFAIRPEIGSYAKNLTVTKSANTGSEGTNPYFTARGITGNQTNKDVKAECPVKLYASEIAGYTFAGWYVKGTNTLVSENMEYEFNMPYEKLEYEARYTNNDYELVINKYVDDHIDPTTDNIETEDVAYHSTYTLSTSAMTGYTFLGWFVSGDATAVSTDWNYEIEMPRHDMTYEARFEINNYELTISYESGNTSWTINPGYANYDKDTVENYDYNESITVTRTDTTDGYKWVGWYVDGEKVSSDDSYTFTMPADDMEIVATWKPEGFSISLDSNGGTISGSSTITGNFGEYFTLPIPNKADGEFAGWLYEYVWFDDDDEIHQDNIYLTDEGLEDATSVDSFNVYSYTERDNTNHLKITAKAIWGQKLLAVTFNTGFDASTYDSNDTQTFVSKIFYGESVPKPEDPIRKGYTFNGWFTADDETGVEYDFNSAVIAAKTLYARWTINQYKIILRMGTSATGWGKFTYYVDSSINGTVVNEAGVTLTLDYGTVITLDTTCYLGRRFSSWTYYNDTTSVGWTSTPYNTEDCSFVFNYAADIRLACNLTFKNEMRNFSFESTETSCTITGLSTYGTNATTIVVPNYVTKINQYAFKTNFVVTSLTLPFTGLARVGSTYLPNKTCTPFAILFGTTANDNARSLKPTYIDAGTRKEYTAVYYIPNSLTTVTITDETQIAGCAFEGCGLSYININDGITSIGDYAFADNNMTDEGIVLPDTVRTIGNYAFKDASDRDNCTFNELDLTMATYIGKGAIANLDITSLYLPFIGKSATATGNESLMTWLFLDSTQEEGQESYSSEVTQNGQSAYVTTYLANVTIVPNSSGYLPSSYAFANMVNLNTVYFDTLGVTANDYNIAAHLFDGCSNLRHIYGTYFENPKYVNSAAFKNCSSLNGELIDEESGTYEPIRINAYDFNSSAFEGCSSLYAIERSTNASNVYVRENAFKGCSSLVSFEDKCTATIWVYDHGFDGCSKLASIDVPRLHPGKYAFANCTSLTTLNINMFSGSGTTKQGIGDYAFLNCTSLSSKINFIFSSESESYKYSIGEGAFKNCTSLTEIVLPSNTTTVGAAILSGCSSLEKLTIPFIGKDSNAPEYVRGYSSNSSQSDYFVHYYFGSERYSGSYEAKNWSITYYVPSTLKEVTITKCASNIVAYAFFRMSSITKVSITGVMNSTYNISAYGLYSTGITSVSFCDGLVEIDKYTCKNLTLGSVELPDSVTYIGGEAFFSCGLTDITLPSNADLVISTGAFQNNNITELEINMFKQIANKAFAGCAALTSISFNYGTTSTSFGSIDGKAFFGCTNASLVVHYYGTKDQFTAIITGGKLATDWNLLADANGSTPAKYFSTISCSDGLLNI